MLRRTTLVMVLAIFALLSAFSAPVTEGQGGPSFAGTWKLTLDFSPGPVFTYGVVAETSEGYKAEEFGPQPLTALGGGLVIGPCELGPGGKANGMTWRHTPLAGDPATGVSLTFDTTSRSSPSTTILRGNFSADGNSISGMAVVVSDTASSANPSGYEVSRAPFTLERVESLQCNLITIP